MAVSVVAVGSDSGKSATKGNPASTASGTDHCTDLSGKPLPCPAPDPPPQTKSKSESGSTSLRALPRNLLLDQKNFWTSPARIREKHVPWLLGFSAVTAGLISSDTSIEKHLPESTTTINRSRDFSTAGVAALVGAGGGLYLWGHIADNDHRREAGLLSGEAAIGSLAVTGLFKVTTRRERPLEGDGKGSFWYSGGTSFPSEHATAAWSVATVLAHEYPGPLTQILSYGLATGVTAGRVIGRRHWSSDVFIGSALGWYMGRQVYRAHHDNDAELQNFGTFYRSAPEDDGAERGRRPENMGSPYVPLDTWIYPAFDRLAAMGYIQTGFAGLRPWTRLECARLVQEAADLLQDDNDDASPEAHKLYDALNREFGPEIGLLDGGRNLSAQIESVYTRFIGISGPPLTDGYNFAQTIINDYGRPYQEGFNAVTGVSARAEAGPLTFYIRGEYQHAPPAPAMSDAARQLVGQLDWIPAPPGSPVSATSRFRALEAYAGINLENWQITVGKQSLWWGPGQGGPMLFSNNAEPVNMLRLNRVSPFKLPSILGWLGPIRTEFFLGQLAGSEFVYSPLGLVGQWSQSLDPQPFIHGQKFSFEPTPNLEFGFFRSTVYGGPGYPLTMHTLEGSLFSTGNEVAGTSTKPGDRRSGLDFSYRIPRLRKWLTFYGDGFTDDEFSPIAYPDRSIWHAGIYMPRIPGISKLDFRAEGVYSDNPIGGNVGPGYYYFNSTWRTGYRNDGNLIGSWIGRAGQGAQAWTTYHFDAKSSVQLNLRHQKVSWMFVPQGGTLTDVGARADFWLGSTVSISGLVQYEKWTFPVLASTPQSNVTTSVELTFWPGHWSVAK